MNSTYSARPFSLTRTIAAVACTLVFGSVALVGAVGPAQAVAATPIQLAAPAQG